jgi:monofunctional biosynthetic peptidoglycan transglycosylase
MRAVAVLVAIPLVLVPLYTVVTPVSTRMLWRSLTGERVERQVVDLRSVAPVAARTVLIAEDARLCRHWGVDWGEVREVLSAEGGPRRGGSSIAMQVARNLFLWQGRGFVGALRKPLEFPLALWIDLVWSKPRLVEVYLNIAEWGPDGEFGIEAGARRAFGKSARELTPREAALMAAMLPNPILRDPKKPSARMARLAGIFEDRARRWTHLTDCLPGG